MDAIKPLFTATATAIDRMANRRPQMAQYSCAMPLPGYSDAERRWRPTDAACGPSGAPGPLMVACRSLSLSQAISETASTVGASGNSWQECHWRCCWRASREETISPSSIDMRYREHALTSKAAPEMTRCARLSHTHATAPSTSRQHKARLGTPVGRRARM